jgi:hypothetical protein
LFADLYVLQANGAVYLNGGAVLRRGQSFELVVGEPTFLFVLLQKLWVFLPGGPAGLVLLWPVVVVGFMVGF